MNTRYKECLGEVLSEKRRLANINKSQLCLMIGVSRLTIRKIENGEANPTTDILLRFSQGVGISLAEVFSECERRMAQLPEDELDEPYVLMQG
ncbi:MAG: helix-turn-helix transcriptional regulator [Eggerthellaceae bacterium]|nr:helix-turn-helix transcriptional regulator [Eggerthellaceae bacterium]